ncbi:MAG: c-type cytochrome, partial [Eudoraea sp.]|nr:c-type cytochrome [Eudoraea sp.]
NHIPTSGIDYGLTLERAIYPIRSNTAVNRGYVPGTLDKEGKLLEFASACGPLIYRGDALPGSFNGDAFICEPTANLIKRNKISEDGFMLSATGSYKNKEFLASTDERFRPISTASGPDGAIYIVDMYKGIIQHGPYMTPYLRKVTLDRKLDKPIHMGRIWRITSKKEKVQKPLDLSKTDSETLVGLLGHSNGWTRDTAQRLLVDRGDSTVIPQLRTMVRNGNSFAKLHALWTLEGLGVIDADLCFEAMSAEDPYVAQTAIRLLMQIESADDNMYRKLEDFISEHFDQVHPVVQMQMVMASSNVSTEIAFKIARDFLETYKEQPLARDVVMSSLEGRELDMLQTVLSYESWQDKEQYREIFLEMLATAITNNGSPLEALTLFSLIEANTKAPKLWVATAVANGIVNAKRPDDAVAIALKVQPRIFKYPENLSAELAVLAKDMQRNFTWPGKPEEAKKSSELSENINREVYALGRQKYLNLCANCHATDGAGMKRFAPPLKNSEWVTGEDYKLAMILLHGMEGPVSVDGKVYDTPDILPSMPSFTTLQNNDIAAIATYIRNSWGNSAPEIGGGSVGRIRYRTQGKITPWKASELDTLLFNEKL